MHARDVHDHAAPLAHRPCRGLGGEKGRAHVYREHGVEVVCGQLERGLRDRRPGVVDEHVEPPEVLRDLVHEPRRRGRIRQVAVHPVHRPARGELLVDRPLLVSSPVRRESDGEAVSREPLRDRPADPGAGSRDKRDPLYDISCRCVDARATISPESSELAGIATARTFVAARSVERSHPALDRGALADDRAGPDLGDDVAVDLHVEHPVEDQEHVRARLVLLDERLALGQLVSR